MTLSYDHLTRTVRDAEGTRIIATVDSDAAGLALVAAVDRAERDNDAQRAHYGAQERMFLGFLAECYDYLEAAEFKDSENAVCAEDLRERIRAVREQRKPVDDHDEAPL